MEKELVKQAFKDAEKSLKDKEVEEVKKIVLKTLEKINDLKKTKAEAEEKIKILKMDLDDLKEGRLDRMAERQEKDGRAKQISVVIIIKEKIVEREVSPWYWPYRVIWPQPYYPCPITITDAPNTTYYTTGGSGGNAEWSSTGYDPHITSSSSKWGAAGTYEVHGNTVNFR